MQNLGFLFAAYTIIWLALFGSIMGLTRRQKNLRAEIESLKQQLKTRESK